MNSPESTILTAAKRFSQALDDAIYDKQLESRERLIFLYDTDLLVNTILGLTNTDPATSLPDVSKPNYVLRALFSVGFLPQAHFLRPHLVELERFVRQISPPGHLESGIRKQQFKTLSKQWELDRHDARVKEYAQDITALQSVIRSEGFDIFVKLELCYGGLAFDRLLRVLPRCAFHESGLPMRAMQRNDRFAEEVTKSIAQPLSRRRKGVNNLVDGYALSELAYHASMGAPVRFYTETDPLVRFQSDPRLEDKAGKSVMRDAVYFIIRSSFPALGFAHMKERPSQTQSTEWTLNALVELSTRLKNMVDEFDSGIDIERIQIALQSVQAERSDHTLGTLLDDFYALKFLGNVFLSRWEVPRAFTDFVPYLAAFFHDQKQVQSLRSAFATRLTATNKALRVRIGNLSRWQNDILEFIDRIEARRQDFDGVVPDPWRDMGLGRWGLDMFLPDSVQHGLSTWLHEVTDDAEGVERLASDLALLVSPTRYQRWEDFALAQSQLWCLKLYDRIVEEWEENAGQFEASGKEVLRILYLVAQVKAFKADLGETKDAQVTKISSFVDQAQRNLETIYASHDSNVEGVAHMGVAHVAYWAWQRLGELNESRLAHKMAEMSFDAANCALSKFPVKSLAWAFAVNHCLYVSTTSRARKNEAEHLWPDLIQANSAYRHYRFADTRARQATEEIRERISHYGANNLATNLDLHSTRRRLCRDIRNAQKVLVDGGSYFGDEEIDDHYKLLHSYQISLRCRDSSIGANRKRDPGHPKTHTHD